MVGLTEKVTASDPAAAMTRPVTVAGGVTTGATRRLLARTLWGMDADASPDGPEEGQINRRMMTCVACLSSRPGTDKILIKRKGGTSADRMVCATVRRVVVQEPRPSLLAACARGSRTPAPSRLQE